MVDDFDGIQRLHVTPGPHDITLRLMPGPAGPVYGNQPHEEPGSSDGYGYDGP